MPLSVQGGLSPEEAQLLGAGMHVYKDPRQETVNIYNELEAHDSSCCGPMFGLSTGATRIPASLVRSVARPRLVCCNLETASNSGLTCNEKTLFYVASFGAFWPVPQQTRPSSTLHSTPALLQAPICPELPSV